MSENGFEKRLAEMQLPPCGGELRERVQEGLAQARIRRRRAVLTLACITCVAIAFASFSELREPTVDHLELVGVDRSITFDSSPKLLILENGDQFWEHRLRLEENVFELKRDEFLRAEPIIQDQVFYTPVLFY